MPRTKRPATGNHENGVVVEEKDLSAPDLLRQVTQPNGEALDSRSNGEPDALRSEKEISMDPESDEDIPVDPEEFKEALSRPPPVNSDYLPLPWKGRLGYACLNTYLRYSSPPVFSSRTCRIASILENRHPLKDPNQPAHPTKNRPDRDQPADEARGMAYVQALGLTNARDIVKMLRWNHKYGIKFMRLSSEMFPFASHEVYGYKLAPFASEVLAEAGRVAAELGHRLTVHPGQFTQLGSPRKQVIESSIRDLEYHSEMLQLLKLPPQQDRDAVMILHMGGVFGDKAATLDRFRDNYKGLSQDIKNRLVLENDDVSWSVHDLLPICEELNIPLVLDFHHHNIIFDSDKVREGTLDIMLLYDRIKATWTRKGITQKMHYSEPTPSAITKRQRRKHNPRVATLPPCDPTMDLMIEAKDKEQAVFELMRTFKLPGWNLFNDIIPHVRNDENKPFKPPRKSPKKNNGFVDLEQLVPPPPVVPEDEVGMGGPEQRVYWPPGMEEWLRPKKTVRLKSVASPSKGRKTKVVNTLSNEDAGDENAEAPKAKGGKKSTSTGSATKAVARKRKAVRSVSISSSSEEENIGLSDASEAAPSPTKSTPARRSRRAKKVNYAEDDTG
ncbi:UV-damage endonuclease [Paecilomyces lecythidis]|uniref:UV-damage endonuclease n=1 Tax=Paecilomyces lecythidis TaxID=3004212 RepID=A0ABR3WVQ2_9EURO